MKLIRFGSVNNEKPGVGLPDGKRIDTSAFGEDYDENFFATDGINRLQSWLDKNQNNCKKVDDNVRLAASICRPSKLICVGLNYAKHAKEGGMEIPKLPIIFFKSTTAIVGPDDDLMIPKNSEKTDWEVELVVVIGKRATYVSENEAMNFVAGYILHNDYS
ncbi:MAG TPA: ureidoglycolate lyase, partial [Cytophagales bacterium]|nr:ureidoglycolate lyase [Cytophagales bacterium]